MDHALSGRPHMMNEDLVRRLRNISSVDNAYKAYGIMQNGIYRSRSGSRFPGEMDTSDAISQLFGFTPREVGQWFERNNDLQKNKKSVFDFQRKMIADWDLALNKIENGDEETGRRLMEEVGLAIDFSGFSEHQKAGIRRGVQEYMAREAVRIHRMIQQEYQRGNPYGAEVVDNTIDAFGTGDR